METYVRSDLWIGDGAVEVLSKHFITPLGGMISIEFQVAGEQRVALHGAPEAIHRLLEAAEEAAAKEWKQVGYLVRGDAARAAGLTVEQFDAQEAAMTTCEDCRLDGYESDHDPEQCPMVSPCCGRRIDRDLGRCPQCGEAC